MASGDTRTQQYLDVAANGTRADLPSDTCCETRTQTLIRGVAERIMDVEDEVERLENNPDVVDIVATYADLQAYDTQGLTDKDVIRVLQDETHDGDSTYYRYNKQADTWTYIGESKQYTDFVGTDGTTAGTNGLVPAPATTDAGKFLKADGTWDTAGSSVNVVQTTGTSTEDVMSQKAVTDALATAGPTVVQTTGTSTTDVMSQNATTSMVFSANSHDYDRIGIRIQSDNSKSVRIGYGNSVYGSGISIGWGKSGIDSISSGNVTIRGGSSGASEYGARARNSAIAIGDGSTDARGDYSVAIGGSATVANNITYAIALGGGSKATMKGQMQIGLSDGSTNGYNDSQYRLLTGLYDPQSDHDAANKEYVDNLAITYAALNGTSAPTTATVGTYVGQLYLDTTNDKMYYLASIDDTVDPTEYTWAEIGGGPTVVQTTGTSTTDVMSQNAVTSMVFADPSTKRKIQIGSGSTALDYGVAVGSNAQTTVGSYGTAIGTYAKANSTGAIAIGGYSTGVNNTRASGTNSIAIGVDTRTEGQEGISIGNHNRSSSPYATAIGNSIQSVDAYGVALGNQCSAGNTASALGFLANAGAKGSVALGAYSTTTSVGEVNIGSSVTSYGYNSSTYRLLTGLYDPQSAHDAATKGYVDTAVASAGGDLSNLTTTDKSSLINAINELTSRIAALEGN